ncbi:hypothetical protein CCH79_00004317, partial [Gambusia affinis]
MLVVSPDRESSFRHNLEQMETEKLSAPIRAVDEDNNRTLFRQYSDKYEEVDAEQLQGLLNGKILQGSQGHRSQGHLHHSHSLLCFHPGDLKSGGFSTDACRSMVALMDTSITGKLNSEEFVNLWKKIVTYKDIFLQSDISQTGTLSLSELRKAITASGMTIGDDMLNIMALRYGASSGFITLENFIALALRFDRMSHRLFLETLCNARPPQCSIASGLGGGKTGDPPLPLSSTTAAASVPLCCPCSGYFCYLAICPILKQRLHRCYFA